MTTFWQALVHGKFKKNQVNQIEWFDIHDDKPRAIVQVSPAFQPNGVFVNYGDAIMYWATREQLEKRGLRVMCLPREKVDCSQLKAQGAKLFLDCGGFIYTSAHHKSQRSAQAASITAHNARCCRNAGGITISAPQTFGPYSSIPEDDLSLQVREMIEQMDIIYARDSVSADHLRQVYPDGFSSEIGIAPDLAFLYQPDSMEAGLRLLSRKGLDVRPGAKPIVGLTLNRQLYTRVPLYLDTMQKVIKFFKARDVQIVLIPHEHGRYGRHEKDDQFWSNYLAKQSNVATLSRRKRFSHKAEINYIHAIEAAIGAVDFLVAGRFHATLRGLSEHVPTVAFSWSHKYETLFKSIGMSAADSVLGPEDFTVSDTGEIECVKLERAWSKREETKRHLASIIPQVKQQVSQFFDNAVAKALST